MRKINFYLSALLVLYSLLSCGEKDEPWPEPPAPPDPPEKTNVLDKITDSAFRRRILQLMETYDTDKDGKLSEEEAAAVPYLSLNGAYNVIKEKISSLQGIEYFTGIELLDCSNNQLTSLDLSHNLKLDDLVCNYNELVALTIKKNNNLYRIVCDHNRLKELDLPGKTKLKSLTCSHNQLTSLDLKDCTLLEEFYCSENQLEELLLDGQKKLSVLYCDNNKLQKIECGNCESLRNFILTGNQVTELDISKCDYLKLRKMNAEENPELKRLWVSKSFREDMLEDYKVPAGITITIRYHLSDDKNIIETMYHHNLRKYFEEAILNELAEYDTDEYKGALSAAEAARIPKLDLAGKEIYRLYNLEYFTGLKELDLSNNKLKAFVSLTNSKDLEVLACSNNSIPKIDLSQCTRLRKLNCSANRLATIDLSTNAGLEFLSCEQNELAILDISHNKKLQALYCSRNPQLKTIYVWKGFDQKQLTHFEVDKGVEIVEKEAL